MAYLLDFIELASYENKRGGYTGNNHICKPMKKRLALITTIYALIATIFATAPDGQAAIVWGSFADTPTTLSGSAVWNSPPPSETDTLNTPNWSVGLTFSRTIKSASVTLDGVHLTAPHPGDTDPGDDIELGVIIPISNAVGSSDGVIYHNRQVAGHPTPGMIPPFGMHYDTWDLFAKANGTGLDIDFKAVHTPEAYVPEPAETTTFTAFGLLLAVGFFAFRRIRRQQD